MRFSVITVCLNPGDKLAATLASVLDQTCGDYEVIVKDGGSRDGAPEAWKRQSGQRPGAEKVRLVVRKDTGIYDAMNQAVQEASGDFLIFMNCGDMFADNRVLERVEEELRQREERGQELERLVLYGDTCSGKQQVLIASAPEITGFVCYRNIPCHQACFYGAALCRKKPYDTEYRIRADYDHFLWCFYRGGAEFCHLAFPVAIYEGDGYSESRENKKRDRQEHSSITKSYMGGWERFRYRALLGLSLAPLRRAIAESRALGGAYHKLKERLYRSR